MSGMTFAEAQVMGFLGRDPEYRTTQGGKENAQLRVITSASWRGADGEMQTRTSGHDVVVWHPVLVALLRERGVRKGALVYAAGELTPRTYKDRDGRDRSVIEIVVKNFSGRLVLPSRDRPSGPTPTEQEGD